MNKILVLVIFSLISCSTYTEQDTKKQNLNFYQGYDSLDRQFPEIDYGIADISVALVKFESGKHFQPFSACLEEDVICMDPPPFLFNTTVLEVLAGKPLNKKIQVANTSHYGFNRLLSGHYLALIYSSNNEYVIPRYQRSLVLEESTGSKVYVLGEDEDIWWMKCSKNIPKTLVNYPIEKYPSAQEKVLLEAKIDFYEEMLYNANEDSNIDECISYDIDEHLTCLHNLIEKNEIQVNKFRLAELEKEYLTELNESISEYKEKENLYTISNGYIYSKYGLTLSNIKNYLNTLTKDEFRECLEY